MAADELALQQGWLPSARLALQARLWELRAPAVRELRRQARSPLLAAKWVVLAPRSAREAED
jgi:hypothetical protein